MQIRVLSEFNFKLAFLNKRTYSRWIRFVIGILQNARLGEFQKLFVHKGTLNLHASSKHKVVAHFVPPNNPINTCTLSLGPRLSLFSEVGYSSNFGKYFWSLNTKTRYQRSGKERKSRRIVFPSYAKSEIRHFLVVVVQ